ncbi:17047_t:CDS:2 [Dentiscutata erythropus]|uniref:17047_t:CDS:1 n=1 Tax=Dentiscutata erythropus TaxID=1348616 RepID=A0A9N9NEG6_9GLOM|nr:17047_t:CDS:2 [Dentiscutata erythropus]
MPRHKTVENKRYLKQMKELIRYSRKKKLLNPTQKNILKERKERLNKLIYNPPIPWYWKEPKFLNKFEYETYMDEMSVVINHWAICNRFEEYYNDDKGKTGYVDKTSRENQYI